MGEEKPLEFCGLNHSFGAQLKIMSKSPKAPLARLMFPLQSSSAAGWGAALAAGVFALTSVRAADVSAYGIVKEQALVQTNTDAPMLRTNQPFAFSAFVLATSTNSVLGAALSVPGGGPITNLTRDTNTGHFALLDRFGTQEDLDAAYPGGSFPTYLMNITNMSDGFKQPQLKFGPDNYPNNPRLTNYASAQAIIANAPFIFQWESFDGGTTGDYVQLIIVDAQTNQVFSSPPASEPNALDGTSNAVTIVANTLQPGRNYEATLIFGKVLPGNPFNPFIYLGVRDVVAYAKRTEFKIQTVAMVPTTRPSLYLLSVTATTAAVRFSSEIGFTYRLEASTNLTNWATLLTTNAAMTNVTYNDATISVEPTRFYRVVSP